MSLRENSVSFWGDCWLIACPFNDSTSGSSECSKRGSLLLFSSFNVDIRLCRFKAICLLYSSKCLLVFFESVRVLRFKTERSVNEAGSFLTSFAFFFTD